MKRIEFIAPVEAIRGNLSGRQDLQYAENNNKAYESPMSQRNYARNYTPRFVGAKRAKDGLKYFTVRTKSAVGMTAKSKHAMALLGGAGAIIGYILGHKSSELYAAVLAQYNALYAVSSSQIGSMRAWLSRNVIAGLDAKQAVITLTGPAAPVTIDNPWMTTELTPNVTISQAVLVKFWSELTSNGIYFKVDGSTGIGHAGEDFDTLIPTNHNILNLERTGTYITQQGRYLLDGSTYATEDTALTNGKEFVTTDVAPEP